ncbi:MAG TPA: transcriptional regulator [Phycisphaerales bacterium]|nr:transcriptional regulator [Phycisphaerales bacterium]
MDAPAATPDLFHALAAPARRRVIDLLAQGPQTVNELLPQFDMSQPALSQHLKILRDAGLVAADQRGRHRHYRLIGHRLREVRDWAARYERFWTSRLDALGRVLEEAEGAP